MDVDVSCGISDTYGKFFTLLDFVITTLIWSHQHSISRDHVRTWVRIPNSEIQSKFRRWIGEDFGASERTDSGHS